MKKISFDDFIEQHEELAALADSIEAMNMFTALSRNASVRAMIDVSEHGRPAVEACADLIGLYCDGSDPDFRIHDALTQRAIDEMIRLLLEMHGYQPGEIQPTDRTCQKNGIREATTYRRVS